MGMLLRRHESYMAVKAVEPEEKAVEAVSEAPAAISESMSRAELAEMAGSMGIEVPVRWGKARIIRAIQEA